MGRVLGGVLLALAISLPAAAHEVEDPRVLVITLRADGLDVRVSERWPAAGGGNDLRQTFDGDEDGRLSPEEAERLRGYLREKACGNLQVRSGSGLETTVELETVVARVKGADGAVVSSEDLTVEVGLRGTWQPGSNGRYKARLADWRPDDHRVRAVVAWGDDVEVLGTQPGKMDTEDRAVRGLELGRKAPVLLLWRAAQAN